MELKLNNIFLFLLLLVWVVGTPPIFGASANGRQSNGDPSMAKTILITGATDGIGFETAKILAQSDHHILLHGRNPEKLEKVKKALTSSQNRIDTYLGDLSRLEDVEALAKAIGKKNPKLDVLINNAGVYIAPDPITKDGLDVRFVVNTIAPYLLTQRLLPLLGSTGRVVNLSSAAQAPVNLDALTGRTRLSDRDAYAQSKLAITMWSRHLADSIKEKGPAIIAVNPGSLLGSKMVRDAFGIDGGDIRIGAKILLQAALSDEFAHASGKYFDNDLGRFAPPHSDAVNPKKNQELVRAIEDVLQKKGFL